MDPRLAVAARLAALGTAALGLAVAPHVPGPPPGIAPVGLAAAALAALVALRPRGSLRPAVGAAWLACVALAAGGGGLALGVARLAAIDAGALRLSPGADVVVRGHVAAVPRRSGGEVEFRVATAAGRMLVSAREPVGELSVGAGITVRGRARAPRAFERGRLARLGVRSVVAADRIHLTGDDRDGLAGALDAVRARAEAALGDGTSAPAATLLRGFVLGQDDRIAAATREDFERSGLAHLLAVSGQNVALLAVLAALVLALLGVPLRARLAWILALIAIYVPVAGAGASIQRAGVMGAAAIVAALAGRPSSRWYALALAACATLALDPRASADVGWQLSFAAVLGILLATAPIAGALAGRHGGWRRALAEAVALTVAATLATAPLMAHHFGAVSAVALPANLVALPAVAPVMWLGMLAAGVGQLPWLPVEPLTASAGALAGFIAAVARSFAVPDWAELELELAGPGALAAAYAALAALVAVALRWRARRQRLRTARPRGRRAAAAALAGLALAGPALAAVLPATGGGSKREPGLRLTALDVGQGDAILLEARGRAPVLVDAGPAQAEVAAQLERRGIERLAALAITHPQSDHDGGVADVLARIETERLLFAGARASTLRLARAAGARPLRLAAGASLRFGGLRLEVLWPPAERLASPRGEDPNLLSLVLLASRGGFEALLAGDAEAEAATLEPGEVEVLKLAHHGSEDAGLGALLERARPRLALISVGAGNPYGHPAPATLTTLAEHGVPTLRTDRDGELEVEVRGGDWGVR